MNPVQHANISVKRRGGELEDYIDIHALIDSTKMLCTDNRHRILHTFWGVQEVIIPIFGHHFENSAGKSIEVKDLCEKDHLLVDFHHRFIPTLGDFVAAMQDIPTDGLAKRLEKFHADVINDPKLSATLLSPLSVTGQLKSLLITHNSWFKVKPNLLILIFVLISFSIRCVLNSGWTMAWLCHRVQLSCKT